MMKLIYSLFSNNIKTTENIRKSIIAFCYGNMVSLPFLNIKSFIETYKENPTRSLKARLFSAALMRLGIKIKQKSFKNIEATFEDLNGGISALLFDFNYYGGVFVFNKDDFQSIVPSYAAIIFDKKFKEEPKIYLLEPSLEPNSTMLIKLGPNGLRSNLGNGGINEKSSFLNLISDKFKDSVNQDSKIKETINKNRIEQAEKILIAEFGVSLNNLPDRASVEKLFDDFGSHWSENSSTSLLYTLFVLSVLLAAKIKRDSGEAVSIESLISLTNLMNRAADYLDKADDRLELSIATMRVNVHILDLFDSFGIKNQ